ncbi:MAG: hypothetical protein V2A54_14305 [Bacteroidota bacterium]
MKKTILFFFIIAAVSLTGCNKSVKEKLLGTWQLESIGKEVMPQTEAGLLEFREDGKMIQKLGGYTKEFKWRVGEDEKTVFFTKDDGTEEKNEILELSNEILKLNSTDGIIILKKK